MPLVQQHASDRYQLSFPTALAVLGLLAVLVGRGLSQALPGTLAGMDRVVSATLLTGSFVTQFFAIVGATLGLRLALWVGSQEQIPPGLRVSLSLSSLAVGLVVFFSAQPRQYTLGPLPLGAVGAATAGLLVAVAANRLSHQSTRAIGLVAGLCGAASLIHVLARALALVASGAGNETYFSLAQAAATVGFGLELGAGVLCGMWLWRTAGTWSKACASVILVCIPALLIGDMTTGARLAVTRSLQQLSSHPDPLLPEPVYLATHLVFLTLVLMTIFGHGKAPNSMLCLVLALLARNSADTPIGALMLSLSALILLLVETDRIMPSNVSEVVPMSQHNE